MNFFDAELPPAGSTVVVGMSGGVDSTLTVLLLKQRGCRVIGATMALWDGKLPENVDLSRLHDSCYGPNEETDIAECKRFCAQQGIEYHVIDVRKQYREFVLEYFKREYRAGRTPNPCIRCNRLVKFGSLLQGIDELGLVYDYFCTGHYARLVRPEQGLFGTDIRPYMIGAAADSTKDQTYFLYRVPSQTLERVRFPLSGMKKSRVYELAREFGLEAANREESQDFIGEEFFDQLFADKPGLPGDIIDLDGKVLGRHRGIEHYTIGQRRGLGVAVNYPVYVQSIDAENNLIVLAPNDALNSSGLVADDFVWPGDVEPSGPAEFDVKIRLASRPARALVERYEPADSDAFKGTPWRITFLEPQRAVAPGQSAVLYRDGVVAGGGIISRVIK